MAHLTPDAWHRLALAGESPAALLGIPGYESSYKKQARLDDERNEKFLRDRKHRETLEENEDLKREVFRLRQLLRERG